MVQETPFRVMRAILISNDFNIFIAVCTDHICTSNKGFWWL